MKYYFYKSGMGNCFLPYLENYEGGDRRVKSCTLPGLYVGFADVDDSAETAICQRLSSSNNEIRSGYDDDNIFDLLRSPNKTSSIVFSFDRRDLVILRVKPRTSDLIIWRKTEDKYKNFLEIIQGDSQLEKRYDGYLQRPKRDNHASGVKFLPVEILKVIPRDQLYMSIDSLSVYQYLNQGTCRPVNQLGATDRDGFEDLGVLLTMDKDSEQPFGAFVRLYFDALWGDIDAGFEEMLNDEKICRRLVLATLNPILFETLAFYLCLDLGLIPEAANGKGLDVIDVRARFGQGREVNSIIQKLKTLSVNVHQDLTSAVEKNRALSIQCKAYAGSNATGKDFLMFRRGTNKSAGVNTLFANDFLNLANMNTTFPMTWQFIGSQVDALRRSLSIPPKS